MSKKLDNILSEEIKRFNKIMSYQDRLNEGHHYKFYEAEEDAPVEVFVNVTTFPFVEKEAAAEGEVVNVTVV